MEIDATCRDPGGLVHFLLQMPCNVVSLRKRQVAINDFPKTRTVARVKWLGPLTLVFKGKHNCHERQSDPKKKKMKGLVTWMGTMLL